MNSNLTMRRPLIYSWLTNQSSKQPANQRIDPAINLSFDYLLDRTIVVRRVLEMTSSLYRPYEVRALYFC